MIVLNNILVPTDFSEASNTALRYARDLARSYGGRVHLLHVTPDLLLMPYSADFAPVTLPDVQRGTEAFARKQIEALLSKGDFASLKPRVEVRTSMSPAAEIVAYAQAEPIDLIVMGTHGREGVAHFLMGSTAERVVRTAPCPVLTVRHPEREFVVQEAPAEFVAIPAS